MTPTPIVAYAEIRTLRGRCIHAARSVAQADIYEIEWEGRPAVVKDFSARPWLIRCLWSRPVLARETRVLARLQGVPGVPQLYARAGREAIVMERLDAERLPRRGETPPPPEFWANTRELMQRVHARGIGHGDLRRKNLLMGPRGEAYLIDFATAVGAEERGLRAWLARFFVRLDQRIDRVTFARIKASYDPAALDADERRWLDEEPWYLRAGRWLKRRVYRLRKPRFWKKTWRKLSRRRSKPRKKN